MGSTHLAGDDTAAAGLAKGFAVDLLELVQVGNVLEDRHLASVVAMVVGVVVRGEICCGGERMPGLCLRMGEWVV